MLHGVESGDAEGRILAMVLGWSELACPGACVRIWGMILTPESPSSPALARFLRPLSKSMSQELARALVELKVEEELRERYEYLATGRRESTLSIGEEVELEDLVAANAVLSILQMEAHLLLAA